MTGSDEEDHDVSMINEMVFLAVLLRRISKEIYHNPKALTVPQKSSVALDLDALLVEWKSRLPEWLNFDVVTLRESESAAKQKLVLHLRYFMPVPSYIGPSWPIRRAHGSRVDNNTSDCVSTLLAKQFLYSTSRTQIDTTSGHGGIIRLTRCMPG
jgi:hypothetical protein